MPSGIQLKATKSGNEYTITGEKFFVPDAHVANGDGGRGSHRRQRRKRNHALCVPANANGITITQLKTVDMTRRLCHVKFDNVEASDMLGKEGEGWPILRRTLDIATAALVGRNGRHRAEGARHVGRLRQDARAVRQADRIVPGGQAQVRRYDGRGRERALADLLRMLDRR